MIKKIFIIVIAVLAIGGFAFYMFNNMGTKSKASSSGEATISLSQSIPNPIPEDKIVSVGVTISANNGNKLSAIDLRFENTDDLLEFIPPETAPAIPLENAGSAFDETVLLDVSTGEKKQLKRLVMVAKRPKTALLSVATIRLRFRAKSFGTTFLKINTNSSVIVGPEINNNIYSIKPSGVTIALMFGTACGNTNCTANQACFKDLCRNQCGSNYGCVGDYHCEMGVCLPGAGSSSSYSSKVPTATPYPTAGPTQAALIFKAFIPGLSQNMNILPNVKLQLRDGGNPIEDKTISLQRVPDTDYFATMSPVDFNISTKKEYILLVKQLKSVRRSFTVTLERGKTTECVSSDTSSDVCGSLNDSKLAPLWLGDSDGFNDGSSGTKRSDSYNRIDAADLQKIVAGYGVSPKPEEPNADFNLDGKIDIFDLGILGRNFGKLGD